MPVCLSVCLLFFDSGALPTSPVRSRVTSSATSLKSPSQTNFKRPFTIVVEGNIGSGKTTFLDNFEDQKKDIEIFAEPVDKWRNVQGHNLLEMMYKDPERYSLLFQTYVQLTMLQQHTRPSSKPIKLMERSLLRKTRQSPQLNSFAKMESIFSSNMDPVLF